jgi:hypothetical protein
VEQTLSSRMKRYALIVDGKIFGIFFIRTCAEIFASGFTKGRSYIIQEIIL